MKSGIRIDPCSQLKESLLNVEKPARYVGGEYGLVKKHDAVLDMAIAFPDLYEIGMSNQALKILYKNLNELDGVRCERVFAPAPDFEAELERVGVPLYTLESGIPIADLDIIGFTLGYELGVTGMLSILKSAHVPLLCTQRSASHPIVLLGGPAASNPLPFSSFVDAVWIGEAENDFFKLIGDIASMKRGSCSRSDILERISREQAIWMPGKKAVRSLYRDFAHADSDPAIFPIPNMKIVQDHGSVEIMRGCPNGCRFCHAGVWYRPMRQKPLSAVENEVESFIRRGGYREISLSSLSSGDYSGIAELVYRLNEKYKNQNISFQLPSLKVSSFSLPLLEKLSEVRKSGLTFAIETPVDAWQLSINKEVSINSVVAIMREAKTRGWKQAKFYFMVGLPVHPSENESEEDAIIDFLKQIKRAVSLSLNVNIGTFVPKAHTPFQWCPQISEEEAHRKLKYIRDELRGLGFKISTHDPFVSTLEGLISRGDERIGGLIFEAFNRGCRLDAWEDHIKVDIWRSVIFEHGLELLAENQEEKDIDSALPWDAVSPGVGKNFLKKEYEKSLARGLTEPCTDSCQKPCGICHDDIHVIESDASPDFAMPKPVYKAADFANSIQDPQVARREQDTRRIVFSFEKNSRAMFWPHLSLVEIFSKAFIRSSLPIAFTEGFNPLPKLDFASPLSLGILAENEIATVDILEDIDDSRFVSVMNEVLPADLRIKRSMSFQIKVGVKKMSSAAMLWGFSYSFKGASHTISTADDKSFRESIKHTGERIPSDLIRTNVLAKHGESYESYFEAYARLYK